MFRSRHTSVSTDSYSSTNAENLNITLFVRSTKKVNSIVHSSNYHVDKSKDEAKKIKTKMVMGVLPGYSVCALRIVLSALELDRSQVSHFLLLPISCKYELYYEHTFYPQHDSMTWTLDYSKKSDMDDVSGQWHLQERDNGRKTRVFYACDIALREFVPGSILKSMSKAALKSATSWVKKHSEQNAEGFHVAEQYGYTHNVPSAAE